jgi:hypothetical protein
MNRTDVANGRALLLPGHSIIYPHPLEMALSAEEVDAQIVPPSKEMAREM